MRMKLVIGLFAVSSLALPLLAQAPHAGGAAIGAPAPVAPHASAPSAQHPSSTVKPASHSSVAVHHSTSTSSSGATHSASGVKVRALDFDNMGSAPLGPHFVGPVSPGGFVNPLAATDDEVKQQRRLRNSGSIILFGGGYGYDYSGQDYQNSDQSQDPSQASAQDSQSGGQQSGGQQQPQYIFVQQVPDPRVQAKQSASDQTESPAAVEHESGVPIPDVGSFTLVTRNGNLLDAVAFTRSNDRLVYITPDGGRRTLAFRDLDVDETQRLNTERGTPITIPPADDAAPSATPKSKPSAAITN
jgi:hypothetical protein